jgi:hypothetical protein
MKTNLLATACAVLSLISPVAFAQTTVTGPTQDAAVSNSQSGSTSTAVGVNDNSNGGVTVGPTTVGPIDASSRTTSVSESNSGAVSGSVSQGGAGGDGGHAASTSNATGGTSSAVTGPSSASSTANPTATNQGNAQSITFNSKTPDSLKTNPTVYAPALTTTLTETCMGSTSGGLSVLGFGGTLGTTWNDSQCVRRLNAREMAQTLGDRDAARALLCQDKDVAEAYRSVGQDCKARTVVATYVGPPPPGPATTPLPPQAADASAPPKETTKMEPIPNPKEPRGSCAASGGGGECGTVH